MLTPISAEVRHRAFSNHADIESLDVMLDRGGLGEVESRSILELAFCRRIDGVNLDGVLAHLRLCFLALTDASPETDRVVGVDDGVVADEFCIEARFEHAVTGIGVNRDGPAETMALLDDDVALLVTNDVDAESGYPGHELAL